MSIVPGCYALCVFLGTVLTLSKLDKITIFEASNSLHIVIRSLLGVAVAIRVGRWHCFNSVHLGFAMLPSNLLSMDQGSFGALNLDIAVLCLKVAVLSLETTNFSR